MSNDTASRINFMTAEGNYARLCSFMWSVYFSFQSHLKFYGRSIFFFYEIEEDKEHIIMCLQPMSGVLWWGWGDELFSTIIHPPEIHMSR